MLIEKKEINIGNLVLVWDWFEACKWLNFFAGVFVTLGSISLFMVLNGIIKSKIVGIGLIVCFFGLMSVCTAISNVIRDDVK